MATNNLSGKIKSIFCQNFVTYDECTMYPAEYLNIIIGPNGTGKSTLVAAIVLGMGGSAKLLSRASGIEDYVKNGTTTAVVRVEIYINNKKEKKQFERQFDTHGKSEYQVDGVVVTHKNYLRIISEFKIQVDNLCQFLPQDRVQDFAKMNPQELLINTITSVCEQNIIDTFKILKDLRKKQQNSKNTLVDDIRRLNDLKNRNEGLKQVLERIEAKKEFSEKINICNAKRLWIEVKELKDKAKEIMANLEEAEKICEQRQKKYKQLTKDQGDIVKKTESLTLELRKQTNKVTSSEQEVDSIISSIEDLESKIRRAKQEFETSKKEQAEREKEIDSEIQALKAVTEELKRDSASAGGDAVCNAKTQTIKDNLSRLKVEISAQMAKRSQINKRLDEDFVAELQILKQRIQSLESVKELKLKLLQSKFPDQYKGVMWLRQNLDKFEAHIYEPMILELNVNDPNHAKYFENSIALRDLLAFTCESKSDMSKLMNYLRIEQQLSISIVYSAPASACQYIPTNIGQYGNLGFYAYLIQLVEGPPAILNYLCQNYHIDKILVGTDKVNQCLDSIPNNVRNYYGGDVRYNVSISKYSREPIRSQIRIQNRNLLSGVDRTELNALKKRYAEQVRGADLLRNERSTIEAKTDELEHQRSEVMKEQRAHEMIIGKIREQKERVAKHVRKLKQFETSKLNIPHLQEAFKQRTILYIKEIIEFQQKKVKCIDEYRKALQEKECASARVNIYKLENEELNRAISDATAALVQSKKLVENIKSAIDGAMKKCRSKQADAKELTNGIKPSDASFPFTKQFAELPDDIEALKEIINDTSARLECLGDADQNVTEEYERRCEQIESLSNAINEAESGDQNLQHQIDMIYGTWIPEVVNLIDTLNGNFGKFMESMEYVGEIILSMKDKWDFDSYGIQIMVQYRGGTKLQALDRYVQSGGERAVAIAIYSLSLQQLTHVPFRCVDEINQGMDPRNERKIFNMLVEETTKVGSSQYFFVTPKLLPNLNDHENMVVHVVHNGKFVKSENFDFDI